MLEEIIKELEINEEQAQKRNDAIATSIQSETDKVRTSYTKQIKELEKYKPVEKSDSEIELENLKKELADTRFKSSLKELGVDDNLSKYLKSDIDMDEFKSFYKGFMPNTQKDFIPNATNVTGDTITKEQFKNMNISQRTKLYNESPELYNQLKNTK